MDALENIKDLVEFFKNKEKCKKWLAKRANMSVDEIAHLMDEKETFEKKWVGVQEIENINQRIGRFFIFSKQAFFDILKSPEYKAFNRDTLDLNDLNFEDLDDIEINNELNSHIETDFEKDRHRGLDGFFGRLIENNLISKDKLDEKMEGILIKGNIPFFYRRLLLESNGGAEDINEIVKINTRALLIDKNERISHIPSNIILRWAN